MMVAHLLVTSSLKSAGSVTALKMTLGNLGRICGKLSKLKIMLAVLTSVFRARAMIAVENPVVVEFADTFPVSGLCSSVPFVQALEAV